MEEKKRVRSEKAKIHDKTYKERHGVQNISVSFKTDADKKEYYRMVSYIDNIGISKNTYIKQLIKSDLDTKGIDYPSDTD